MFGNAPAMSICDMQTQPGQIEPGYPPHERQKNNQDGEFITKCVVIRHLLFFISTDNAAVNHAMAVMSPGAQNEY